MRSKYIVIRHGGVEVPVVFSEMIPHSQIAGSHHVLSAGFCGKDANGNWFAEGGSDSLSLTARLQDTEILNTLL